jgi:glycerol-3-phosphate cytidylyltransferase-like family protein
VTLGLHYIFPVDAQLSWISSVSIEEAHALKEDYISSLEIDIIALERQENDSIERLSTHLSRYGEKTVGY